MNKKGFTLVELMVVLTITSILILMARVIYGNVQMDGRDARRRADVNAIANAMDSSYGRTTTGRYDPLVTTMFASGNIPTDPLSTNVSPDGTCRGVCKYCVRQGPISQTQGACTIPLATAGPNVPLGGTSFPFWMICANLERGGFYCRGNTQ